MKHLSILLVAITLFFTSCNNAPTSDEVLAAKTETSMQEANAELGMPAIKNYQEKKLLKSIYELRDDAKLINYAYLFSSQTGKLIFIGKCIGYGIPYATQYSSPEKEVWQTSWYHTMPQAEPNGLFMPADTHATWLMMLDATGNLHATYVEPDVIVSQFPLTAN